MTKSQTIVLSVFISIFLSGCATVDSNWREAEAQNTTEAYREFLNQYPESSMTAEARDRIRNMDWENARKSDTGEANSKFLAGIDLDGNTRIQTAGRMAPKKQNSSSATDEKGRGSTSQKEDIRSHQGR